ncbi:phosphotransferase [Streptomyces sp. NPDC050997]|uniref:phosphotransferase n=1 Tax=Streptomyces sp. NPDC050997 TaxID=3155519 RepID=UPI0034162E71
MPGGAVSGLVERITLHLSGGRRIQEVQVVRKRAFPHEAGGLEAVQAIRPAATAVPELIAWGESAKGAWLISPFLPGSPLPDRGAPVPANLFDSLARLHAHFHGATNVPAGMPRVDPQWWQQLCHDWVLPQIDRHRGRHPASTITRARVLINRVADHPAVGRTLPRLTPTLLHGDVHSGNVLIDGQHAWLIDWGSCRVGPAMLDLANLVSLDSDGFAVYRQTWEEVTGSSLDIGSAELGYRWAALQIPVQCLPWMIGNLPTTGVEAAVDRADQALAAL